MTKQRFETVHKLTAEFEGGWSNHPADNGGKTMYGITDDVWRSWLKRKGLPYKPVRQIAMSEAKEIYFEDYWLEAGCDKLALGVDRMCYDAAVNSGVSRARKWLLASIGGTDQQTVKKMAATRMAFLRVAKDKFGKPAWPTYGNGWSRRVNAMENAALGEVGKASIAKSLPPAPVNREPPELDYVPQDVAPKPQIAWGRILSIVVVFGIIIAILKGL